MERKKYVLAHTLIASFIAPVAFMFLVTGGLYTWGITGSFYPAETFFVEITKAIEPNQEAVELFVTKQLAEKGLNPPTGEADFRVNESGVRLRWTGSNLDLNFSTTKDSSIVKFEIRETTLHKRFVQLHKAKGGLGFKIYASILAISLFLLIATGYILAWKLPKYKKLTIITSIVGILFFIFMVWLG